MRLHAVLILTVGLLVAADLSQGAGAQDELKKFEGTWTMVSGEMKGEKLPEEVVKKGKLTIMGDKHTVLVGNDTIVGSHKLVSTAKPMTIDVMETEGPDKGQTLLGIYTLEGDIFTVCFAPAGKERPKESTTKSGTGGMLHVWKRQE